MTTDKPKRRWYQFSLRALLVVGLVFVIGVGWIGIRMKRAQENREALHAAVEEIERIGGTLGFATETKDLLSRKA
jgi:hypothetical protein